VCPGVEREPEISTKEVGFTELPKTATGKIQKFKLREKEWQGRERRGN
jgi:fatty-acyl-CoA synthase